MLWYSLEAPCGHIHLGPVVQSIVRLTCSLVVKLSTVLVSTISNLQVFLLKKFTFFFSKNVYAILSDQSFNETLTISLVEQLGPGRPSYLQQTVTQTKNWRTKTEDPYADRTYISIWICSRINGELSLE